MNNKSDRLIPENMKAVRLREPGGPLIIETVPVPVPGHGEVLIRIHASPVNPSDFALLAGGYMGRNYPFTPGLEGSGTVVRGGGGLMARLRKGKMVACSPDPAGDGTWAEYMKTSAMRTVTLPSGLSAEQGAMTLVNPMTALAFMEMARKGGHRAMVNNAAASALGKMLIRLTKEAGLPLICIVRREDQMEELKAMGTLHLLNSSAPGFAEALKQLASDLGATLLLDAVGGEQGSALIGAAPHGATLVQYARLSGEPLTIEPEWLLQEGKRVEGFLLNLWLETLGLPAKLGLIRRVRKALSGTLSSPIHRIMPLEEVEHALAAYKENMSAGKYILKP